MWNLLIKLFVIVSERIFLRWYDSIKSKEVKNAKDSVDRLSDSDADKQLRDKWQRD